MINEHALKLAALLKENVAEIEASIATTGEHDRRPQNLVVVAPHRRAIRTGYGLGEEVADRMRRLSAVIPVDRLGVTTDCGLILLQRYICQEKLHALVEGTKLVREELKQKKAA